MPGMPSDRYAKGYKVGSSSDPTRPLDGSELIFVELTTEEDPHERVRVALTADIVNDLGFATTDVNETLVLSKADGGQVALKIENGLIVSVRHGAGTEADPYQVWTPTDLDMVREALDAWYVQMDDIDLAAYANWVPIGEIGDGFTGTYNGGGYKITGLVSAPATGMAGLFGELSGATITDLEIEDGDVTSASSIAGLLFGRATLSTISGCVASGTVEGPTSVGGLGGLLSDGTITECGANVEVTGSGSGKIGGLLGQTSGAVSKCYAIGDIVGAGSRAGGLCGSVGAGGTVADSYSQGDVLASTSANGGLIGSFNSTQEIITNSYSTGVVNNGAVNNGLIGVEDSPFPDPVLDSCYWDITINSGLPTPNFGADGTTTADMKKEATYVGWDFTAITGAWEIEEDAGYPTLQWQAG